MNEVREERRSGRIKIGFVDVECSDLDGRPAGCDLPVVGGLTHPFMLFDPVLERYE